MRTASAKTRWSVARGSGPLFHRDLLLSEIVGSQTNDDRRRHRNSTDKGRTSPGTREKKGKERKWRPPRRQAQRERERGTTTGTAVHHPTGVAWNSAASSTRLMVVDTADTSVKLARPLFSHDTRIGLRPAGYSIKERRLQGQAAQSLTAIEQLDWPGPPLTLHVDDSTRLNVAGLICPRRGADDGCGFSVFAGRHQAAGCSDNGSSQVVRFHQCINRERNPDEALPRSYIY